MNASQYFPESYQVGRAQFRDLARQAGGALDAIEHPGRGPDGGSLSMDTVWFGPTDPEKALLVVSATHGVEGHCGSGCQAGWLAGGGPKRLPPGMGALVIHAVNPHGFAWTRRVTEDNVDLNRNFIDFAKSAPANTRYDQIAEAVAPREWEGPVRAASDAQLHAYADRHGDFALQAAITGGQYHYPGGLFYGGTGATWSHRNFLALADRYFGRSKAVAFVDLHTGLGPYGYGEPISGHHPGTPGIERAKEWFGKELTSPEAGSSTSAPVVGMLSEGFERRLPNVTLTAVALEYGTQPVADVIQSLRADNWLHLHGDLDSPQGRAIKRQIRDAFYQDKDDWKAKVLPRAIEIIDRAVAGLARA